MILRCAWEGLISQQLKSCFLALGQAPFQAQQGCHKPPNPHLRQMSR